MESAHRVPCGGSNRLGLETSRHGLILALALALCSLAPGLAAQPAAGSITTHSLPFNSLPFEQVTSLFQSGFTLPPGTGVFHTSVMDAAGNVYSTGGVGGPAIIATLVTGGAAQTQPGGGTCQAIFGTQPCYDAYVAKADASGKLVFGTLLGGPTTDFGTALTVDAAGNVFVAGVTAGSFPTTANAAISSGGASTAFAAKISADGSRFLYVTYLPTTVATANAIAVDGQGDAYVAGQTTAGHAYIAKLNPGGSAFLYYITLAGSNRDAAAALLSDGAGNLLVAGQTSSPDFPVTPGALQRHLAGAQNVFATGLDPNGSIAFSTYLGGSGADTPNALQTDAAGNIYVAGTTTSLDFPVTAGVFQPAPIVPLWNNEAPGGFIARLSPGGSAIGYASYVMSTDNVFLGPYTGVPSLAVTAAGDAYIAGATGAGFPVTENAPRICFNGPTDAFVAHLDSHGVLLEATYAAGTFDEYVEGVALATDGSVLLQWSDGGNASISQIRFGSPDWTAPACLSPNALNAATMYSSGAVAPGEFVALTGFGIGPDTGVAYTQDAQGRPPLTLAGVEVLFDGQAAPLLYVQSRQVNVLAPFELRPQASTTIEVRYNGSPVGSATVPVAYGQPGIFRLHLGVSSQAAAINQDGTANGFLNPAAPGSVVSIWGTGFGSISPPCATGGMNPFAAVSIPQDQKITLQDLVGYPLGGHVIPALYAGSAPGMLCGVDQINMSVPPDVHGAYLFFPEAGGSGGGGVTIAVK